MQEIIWQSNFYNNYICSNYASKAAISILQPMERSASEWYFKFFTLPPNPDEQEKLEVI
jgi:hypothetical protein